MARHNMAGARGRQEIILTRLFDAPRELVWKAWTDPQHFQAWWGPAGYTCPFCEIDLRVGGSYLTCMRSSGGRDIWSTGVYREITPMERLVMTDCFADEKGNVVPAAFYGMSADFPLEMLITVTLEEEDSKTRMTLRHTDLPTGSEGDGAEVGWTESFDKLAQSLH